MTINPCLRAAVAAAGIIAITARPAAWARAAASEPIEIQTCTPVFESTESSPYAAGFQLQTGIVIRFVNRASAAARQIQFRIGEGPAAPVFVEHGSFAPGVSVRATFDTGVPVAAGCRVETAQFADGVTYSAATAITAVR